MHGLRFVRQEPNTDALRRSVAFNVVTPFLLGLWRHGAFGAGEAEDVFTVICDATNNPATGIGQFVLLWLTGDPAGFVSLQASQIASAAEHAIASGRRDVA